MEQFRRGDLVFDVIDAGKTKSGVPLRIFVAHGFADQATYATKNLGPVFDALETTIGMKYPYDKLDLVAVPEMGGAMENAGMITSYQAGVLSRPAEETVWFQQGFWSLFAHEGGHQWFGDAVTPYTWQAIWLNEGFATYTEWLYSEQHGGKTAQQFFDAAYASNGTAWSGKVTDPGRDHIFDDLVYTRAAMTLHELRTTMGDAAFFRLLKAWPAEHRYGNDTTAESLAKLKPAFRKSGGSVTAGNSSTLNDGAAAVVVVSRAFAKAKGLRILGVIRGAQSAGVDPRTMGIGPVPAMRKLFARTGLSLADFDLFELNEAFAPQVLAVLRDEPIPAEKLNVNGGAIALGHPIGCTGTRIVVTLVHEMLRRKARRGLATLCVSGGMGMAIAVEAA